MNLREQYVRLSQELDAEQYKLHSLEQQIRGAEAVTNQIVASAKKIGRLEEKIANLENYMNQ